MAALLKEISNREYIHFNIINAINYCNYIIYKYIYFLVVVYSITRTINANIRIIYTLFIRQWDNDTRPISLK